jgi:hypothetical protein
MKHYYYYGSDAAGSKRTTTCITHDPDSNRFSYGMAICSPLDNFSKKIGRAIAKGRSLAALQRKTIAKIARPIAVMILASVYSDVVTEKAGILSKPRNSVETKIIKSALGIKS